MAFQVSPGINTSEIDATTVVSAVSTTETGLAGVFRWGPVLERTLVTDEVDLVAKFGKPTNLNPETFFTGANFLGYGNALHVVRVVESGNANTSLNATSAYANTGAVGTTPAIKNYNDFLTTTLDANVAYVAKYMGALGSSLRISQCDSANAFSSNVTASGAGVTNTQFTVTSGANTGTVVINGANTASVNAAAATLVAALTLGDRVTIGDPTTSAGVQKLRLTSIGAVTTNATAASVTLSFANPYTLTSNYSSNTISRAWRYERLFDRAPGVSQYMKNLSLNVVDEVHVVIVDEDGLFTGAPETVLEVWPALSRATDAKTTNGSANYYKDILNSLSKYVYVGVDRSGATTGLSSALTAPTTNTPYVASLTGGQDGNGESAISLGLLASGYDLFKSADDVDVSILMQGKARGVSADSDTSPSSSVLNYSTLANYIISNVAEYRKDVVVCVSPAKADVVAAADKATAVTQYLTNMNLSSSYGIMDSGYKYQLDKYNNTYRWIPLNGDIAGCLVRTDFDRDPWYSPAGAQRGRINNVVKLAWNPGKAERDILYKAGVNPVIIQKGDGCILFGDKTLIGRASAFDRINVRRLFIVLEKAIANASKFALFEFNDHFTRNRFVNIVEPYLRDVKGRRGIYDFKVVCDETNNTDQVIDTNSFVGDIYIKPAKSINYIQLNFVAVATGVEFTEIVGQVV